MSLMHGSRRRPRIASFLLGLFAILVVDGVLTGQQRVLVPDGPGISLVLHAKSEADRALAKHFDSLSDIPMRAGYIAVFRALPPDPVDFSEFDFLRAQICNSDLVAIGSFRRSSVLSNTKGTALFTLYTFVPEETLKPASTEKPVRFAVAGGQAETPVGRFAFSAGDLPQLGRRYAIMGDAVPGADAFVPSGYLSVVLVDEAVVRPRGIDYESTRRLKDTPANYRTSLGNAAATCRVRK